MRRESIIIGICVLMVLSLFVLQDFYERILATSKNNPSEINVHKRISPYSKTVSKKNSRTWTRDMMIQSTEKSEEEVQAERQSQTSSTGIATANYTPGITNHTPQEQTVIVTNNQPDLPPVTNSRALIPGRLADPATRLEMVRKTEKKQMTEKEKAWQRARQEGWEPKDNTGELMAIKDGRVCVYQSENAQAAISTAADLVRGITPYNVTGTGVVVGVWDEGGARTTHQELAGRAFIMDGAALLDHSTHVAGTIAAYGIISSARGMAPGATINSYEWNNDLSEMTSRAMADPDETNTFQLSNHSYGHKSGWNNEVSPPKWYGLYGEREAINFGLYDWSCADWDELCWNAMYFLPFKSVGNDRGESAPGTGVTFSYYDNGWQTKPYDPNTDPYSDNWDNGGLDTITDIGNAKNIITVGAVEDAVSNGVRFIGSATVMSVSCWGPTDDGRIKPDIMANGNSLYSCLSSKNTSYGTKSGTSMAAPNAAGSAALLVAYYSRVFPNQRMLNSSIKGLILHTADDLRNPGPDYMSGWGLMNTKAAADFIKAHADFPYAERFREDSLSDTNENDAYTFIWNGSTPIKATLCWTDPAGTPESELDVTTPELVNDLDIRIVDPSGITNFPYILNPSAPTNYATMGDNYLDNVEQVYIASPSTQGVYSIFITVDGSLSSAIQPYSLFISGLTAPPVILHTAMENTFETNTPYTIDANIISMETLATNEIFVLWNTNGSTSFFTTNILSCLSNNLYRGSIPAQPEGTTVSYFLYARATNGLYSVSPGAAPVQLYHFDITRQITLTVSAAGGQEAGSVTPDYGMHIFASGVTVNASSPLHASENTEHRFTSAGWNGTGSAPLTGTSNSFCFRIDDSSSIEWLWLSQYSLKQTLDITGYQTNTWFNEGTTASTITADWSIVYNSTNYQFTEWQIDGSRWPDETNTAANPASGFLMTTSRTATAVYIPANYDSDSDDLPDWWERFCFGNLNQSYFDDPDNDDYLNLEEYQDRSNPNDYLSFPVGPVILHTPLENTVLTPAPWQITATVTDNYDVASVILRWRRNSLSWRQISMTESSIPGQYTNSIPAPGIYGDVYEYKIEATDYSGYLVEDGPHVFSVVYPVINTSTDSITVIILPGTSSNVSLSLGNTGNTSLVWSASTQCAGLSDNIENGSNTWTHTGQRDNWHITTNRYYSSSNAWYCGSDSTYRYLDSCEASLITPPVQLAKSSRLIFNQWIAVELDTGSYAWDGGVVEISTDGVSYSQITPVGGYPCLIVDNPASPFAPNTPCFAGTGAWQRAEFDLSSYAGENIRIRFRFGSDGYITDEGWYIDDVQITPSTTTNLWLSTIPTNGIIETGSSTNATISFDSTAITSGKDDVLLWSITSNDPVTPVKTVEMKMQVRSIPLLSINTPAQIPADGSGHVVITNFVYDVDSENCSLEILYSTDTGATWCTAIVHSAQSSLGTISISNNAIPQISNIISTNSYSNPETNLVMVTISTTSGPAPIVLCTNLLLKTRVWDGIFWSVAATSQPFMVDNEPPAAPSSISASSHTTGTWASCNIHIQWIEPSDGKGAGIYGYQTGLTNRQVSFFPFYSTCVDTQDSVTAWQTGTNWWITARAVDMRGNVSTSATAVGPFWIDLTPPVSSNAVITTKLSGLGNYTLSANLSNSWSGFTDNATGISGYYYSINDPGMTNAAWTTATNAIIGGSQFNQTNIFYVWARDNVGLTGLPATASILVLEPSGDFDRDGLSNEQEETAGTDANNAGSVFSFVASDATSTGTVSIFTFQWPSATGRFYNIYRTHSMYSSNWLHTVTNIAGTGLAITYTNIIDTNKSAYFRVNVNMP